LTDLYLQRAQQLRDNYDYLILAVSGGADSDNILQTFINNKIKLDEVWSDWPINLIEKSNYQVDTSTNPANMASEWFLAAKPALNKLKISNPEIKIHISDHFQYGPKIEDFEDSPIFNNSPTHYVAIKRWRYINEYIDKNFKNKKVAVITGNDKPIPVIHPDNQTYGFAFCDFGTHFRSHSNDINKAIEYFYWSPDFPELPVIQALRVWDYLKLNPTIIKEKFKFQNPQYAQHDTVRSRKYNMDQIIKLVCYPYWDFSIHQCDKPYHGLDKTLEIYNIPFTSVMYSRLMKNWINEPWYQSYISNVNQSLKFLDPEIAFQNGKDFKEDLKLFYNYHILGEVGALLL
jgi:hypothetical protein